MKLKTSKGAIVLAPIWILYLLLGGGAIWGTHKLLSSSANKAPPTVAALQVEEKKESVIVKKEDNAKISVGKDAQEEFAMVNMLLRKEPSPSKIVSQALAISEQGNANMAFYFGPLAAQRISFLSSVVDGLESKVAKEEAHSEAMLTQMAAQNAQHVELVKTLETQLTDQHGKVLAATDRVISAETRDHATAVKFRTIIYGGISLGVLLIFTHFVLPVASMVIPQLAPLSKAVHDAFYHALNIFHVAAKKVNTALDAAKPTINTLEK